MEGILPDKVRSKLGIVDGGKMDSLLFSMTGPLNT